MDNSLLLETVENLQPLGVLLCSSVVTTHEDFNRHNCHDAELEVQFKGGPGSEYKAMIDEDEISSVMVFQFHAGVRLVDSSLDKDADGYVKAEISAVFESEYQLKDSKKFSEDGMVLFLNRNVHIHVWPFWREFVQSTCTRIGISVIEIPFRMHMPAKKEG